MTRFQYAFLVYYSSVLFAALAGCYKRVCSRDMKAWKLACSLYSSYKEAIGGSRFYHCGETWGYLNRV